MPWFYLFLSIFVSFASAIVCPNGYSPGPGDACYSTPHFDKSYIEAGAICSDNGTFLLMPKSEEENSFATKLADKSNNLLLIGLTCGNNSKTSCLWDSGEPLGYHNFAEGQPDMGVGPCVRMQDGVWYSYGCTKVTPYSCELVPNAHPQICLPGYVFFHNNCYYGIMLEDNPEMECQSIKGDLVSIHSPGENSFVFSMLQSIVPSYSLIGLHLDSGKPTWLDGTTYDYDNFKYFDQNLGSCAIMSFNEMYGPLSTWTSSPCETDSVMDYVLCKKPAQTAPTTLSPPTCKPNDLINGTSGMVYSPNYPYAIDTKCDCSWVMAVDPGQLVRVDFSDLNLDPETSLTFYGAMFGNVPLDKWTGYHFASKPFTSTTNFLRIELQYTGDCINQYCTSKYKGEFYGVTKK